MCGRFTQKSERKIIAEEFYVQQFLKEPEINYNVAPSQEAGVILNNGTVNIYDRYRWGLIPHWAKDQSMGNKMINARIETLLNKPSFKGPFIHKRCIIPVDGFFEWKKEKKRSIPYYIYRKDERPFALAGLWDEWFDPDGGENAAPLRTFTIITVDSAGPLRELHDRMPAIVPKEAILFWLDTSNKDVNYIKKLRDTIAEPEISELTFHRVSTIVNSPINNIPDCIKPVEEAGLF